MLGSNYKEQLERLIQGVSWDIKLPASMDRFFQETGPSNSIQGDQRRAARLVVRTKCILIPESPLPAFPRETNPIGVYTSDISRHGVGFIASKAFLPEEEIRLILPTFWLRATIARSYKVGPNCYQIGARLTSRHDPSNDAFSLSIADSTKSNSTESAALAT